MMECKKALMSDEVGGDISKAMDWLRAKGIAKASAQVRIVQMQIIYVSLVTHFIPCMCLKLCNVEYSCVTRRTHCTVCIGKQSEHD